MFKLQAFIVHIPLASVPNLSTDVYKAVTLALVYATGALSINRTKDVTEREADAFSFTALASVGAYQASDGQTRIYRQLSDGSVWETAVNGVFFEGNVERPDQLIVPASEALLGTPIAAVANNGFADRVLLDLRHRVDWRQSLSSDAGSRKNVSYDQRLRRSHHAVPVRNGKQMRVGFNSAGTPGGLTEAAMVADGGTWQVSVLN
ncbi:hypothetical protein DFH08DRAFT_810335 [Mycena albidolilacea]|uniref:Uncharacterized protein n=1 Tax=Mycena albidolilacea TaxID=1033008 RepID=A0AAD6ZXV9_9AGAR|nr:hypothetical protein DFH08DRAFT_810335 [Mycena albidolilacea]